MQHGGWVGKWVGGCVGELSMGWACGLGYLVALEHIKTKEKVHVVVFQHREGAWEEGVGPYFEGVHVDAAEDFTGADSIMGRVGGWVGGWVRRWFDY